MKNKSIFFPLLQLYFHASRFFACERFGDDLGDASLSGRKGGAGGTVKQQFVFCWLQALHHRRVSSFRRGRGSRSRAARCSTASLWLPLIDAPPAATLHSRAPARGQQACVTPDCRLMSHVNQELCPPMGRLVDKTPACQFAFFFFRV